jgi:hypothetical protein
MCTRYHDQNTGTPRTPLRNRYLLNKQSQMSSVRSGHGANVSVLDRA